MADISEAGPAAVLPELDKAVADLFDLDVRVGPAEENLPADCSADCTNDGCTGATKC